MSRVSHQNDIGHDRPDTVPHHLHSVRPWDVLHLSIIPSISHRATTQRCLITWQAHKCLAQRASPPASSAVDRQSSSCSFCRLIKEFFTKYLSVSCPISRLQSQGASPWPNKRERLVSRRWLQCVCISRGAVAQPPKPEAGCRIRRNRERSRKGL